MDLLKGMLFFKEVVESGSLVTASQRLDVAPSSVSRKLNQLEKHLEVKLLHRTTRNIKLTQPGNLFYQRSKEFIHKASCLDEELRNIDAIAVGTLKLNVPLDIAATYIAPLLNKFHKLYPGINIELIGDDRNTDIINTDVDLTIRAGKLKSSGLICRRLHKFTTWLCASPDYIENYGAPVKTEDLTAHNCLCFSHENYPTTWTIKSPLNHTEKINAQGSLKTNTGNTLLHATLSGLGVGMLADWYTEPYINTGQLVRVMSDYEISPSFMTDANIYLVYLDRDFLPEKIRCFIDFLVSEKT